ncbi:MAG: efflux RND transporter periplasmic adaptor subunit, partial [Chloroflexota bacterium]
MARKQKKSRKKSFLITLVVMLILGSSGGYYYYNQVYLPAQIEPEPELQTAKVRTGDIVLTASGIGNITPADEADAGFRTNGVIIELNVALGESVEEGQILARLDDSTAELQLAQAELNWKSLTSITAISEAELASLNAQATYDKAVETLIYTISPSVYRWENSLVEAQAALTALETDSSATEEAVKNTRTAVADAEANLRQAQTYYQETYAPATFTFSYIDPEIEAEIRADAPNVGAEATELALEEAEIDIFSPPTQADIDLARANVVDSHLQVQEAALYLEILKGSADSEIPIPTTGGAKLTQLAQARLSLNNAQLALDNAALVAPISGTVTSLNARVGQSVGTSPIMTISALDQLIFHFYLEESDLSYVSAGKRVVVVFEAFPDVEIDGTVLRIEPVLATLDGSPVVDAWAELTIEDDMSLLAGMAGDIEVIAAETYEAIVVPIQALRELAPNSFAVFVVGEDQALEMRPVTVGLRDFANAEILSGLEK